MLAKTAAHQYIEATPAQGNAHVNISVVNADCLVCAHSIASGDMTPVCVLNMANQHHVGGDYLCARGQEESLVMRSNLLERLLTLDGIVAGNDINPHLYQLPGISISDPQQNTGFGELTCLYTSDVLVHTLKDRLSTPFTINVISSAAYNLADEVFLPSPALYKIGTILKIINQLRVAKHYGQRNLILGAFGCGAFQNQPDVIAEIYHAALFEYEFLGCFDEVAFCIKPTYATEPNSTFDVFQHQFSHEQPYRLISDLLSEAARELEIENHSFLHTLLSPFYQFQSTQALSYKVSLMLTAEINRLKNCDRLDKLIRFLQKVLQNVHLKPNLSYDTLATLLWNNECNELVPRRSIFKQTSYPIIHRLRALMGHSQTSSPSQLIQNAELHQIATDFITNTVIAKANEFIACCLSTDDKNIACYLLYIAATKNQAALAAASEDRFVDELYTPIHDFLRELNKLCTGISNHEIMGKLTDLQYCNTDNQAQWYSTIHSQFGLLVTQTILKYLEKSDVTCDFDLFESSLSNTQSLV